MLGGGTDSAVSDRLTEVIRVVDPSDDSKNTIATRLVDRLREAILSGDLKPGQKINLDAVRRSLDVSLSPLREALARLTATGLVALHDNRGYSVTPLSLNNLAEITRLRVECEGMALGAAIRAGDSAWEGEVMRALHRLNRTVRDPADLPSLAAWETAHRDFHRTLIAGCHLPLLLDFCGTLHNLNDRYRRILLVAGGGDRNVAMEHGEIAQGAVARDEAYAVSKLREHISRTGARLLDHLKRTMTP
ncbi:GntR family transcriptional regulator [Lichenifustis flavocetrariae]|uniref:GntR family transcriptional regulator n=1 Tax=Lichenifustis flavocetrariae TaxID=2949735 RepID=A0AA41YUL5_9HYPH|nr:GntR family transcriptional regulator [Lichenifustis flavocetrariae]MCW6508424.1 GntR family transcriptional regulator [Lichenifustis flavocetrariae]